MSDIEHPDRLAQVRDHYRLSNLTARVATSLLAFGPEGTRLTPQQLGPLDHFHTRGVTATDELAQMARVGAADQVLDVGSGLGGPARFLAWKYGCSVLGVDLSAEFTEAARYLTERTGQTGRVSFETGNALELPCADQRFDVVLLQHVAMNIQDRATLYREVARVLKANGRFATYDIVRGNGEPDYPVPWAGSAETSFLLTQAQTADAIERAGFRSVVCEDQTDTATAWFVQMRSAEPPPGPTLAVVLGTGFAQVVGNLARSLAEGRIRVIAAVFEAP